eukprot:642601-Pelagomonas_calceolata.AAC.1
MRVLNQSRKVLPTYLSEQPCKQAASKSYLCTHLGRGLGDRVPMGRRLVQIVAHMRGPPSLYSFPQLLQLLLQGHNAAGLLNLQQGSQGRIPLLGMVVAMALAVRPSSDGPSLTFGSAGAATAAAAAAAAAASAAASAPASGCVRWPGSLCMAHVQGSRRGMLQLLPHTFQVCQQWRRRRHALDPASFH